MPDNRDAFAVVGNCQAGMVADAIQSRFGCRAVEYALGVLQHVSADEQAAKAAELTTYRRVFVQSQQERPAFGVLRTSVLAKAIPDLLVFPGISYDGFHPDICHIIHEGRHIESPLGRYNSSLAAACWLEGLSPCRTVSLFNTFFFSRLGYFERHRRATAFVLDWGRQAGWDMTPLLAEWRDRGVFMHTHNHPKAWALASIARELLVKAGVRLPGSASGEDPRDRLQLQPRWPVYPALAERFGVETEGYRFEPRIRNDGSRETLDLESFVEGSHRAYDAGGIRFEGPTLERVRKALRDFRVR